MIERVLENWLDKANERSFQVPLCHALAAKGHRVVHLSRHTAMEMGKDILTIGPDGVPCAFQLKGTSGGKLSMSDYRSDVQPQLHDLVLGQIVHPSIPAGVPHRAYLVVNGELQEEVSRAIADFNAARTAQGLPDRLIHTIVRGDLFKEFQELEDAFFPTAVSDMRSLLELYMDSGKGPFAKSSFADLLGKTLPFDTADGQPPPATIVGRSLASGAVLCALSLSAFTNADNHAAEFEAWTMYFAYLLAVAEKWGLPDLIWKSEAEIALRSMVNALARLCDELIDRPHLLEGETMLDPFVYRIRVTYLLGLMGVYSLWRKSPHGNDSSLLPGTDTDHDAFLNEFSAKYQRKLELWGEYASPQLLAQYLAYRNRDATIATELFLFEYIKYIGHMYSAGSDRLMAGPYSNPEEVLSEVLKLDDPRYSGLFPHASYTLEAFVQVFVRCNFKQPLKLVWPMLTRVSLASYLPDKPWEYYLWKCEGGMNRQHGFEFPQQWSNLRARSAECQGAELPPLLRRYPIQYLAFLLVFPHRWNTSGVRWVASQLIWR